MAEMAIVPAPVYSCISDLKPLGDFIMRLRVFSLWDGTVPTRPGEIMSFNVLFIDENGHAIQASGSPSLAASLRPNLVPGSIVELRDFVVEANMRSYRYAICPYSLKLTDATDIHIYTGADVAIPEFVYHFVGFNSLRELAGSNVNLIGPSKNTQTQGREPLRDTSCSVATI